MQLFGNSDSEEYRNKPNKKTDARSNFILIGGGIGVVVIVFYMLTAAYPSRLFSEVKDATPIEQTTLINSHPVVPDGPLKTSSEKLAGNTEQVWAKLFRQMGKNYTKPALQLFIDTITAESCGYGKPITGSFYCQAGKILYIDLSVLENMKKTHPQISDFAQAYIIAHQAGHHIQNLLGISAKLDTLRFGLKYDESEKLSEREELQADYFAGVWAHYARKNKKPVDQIDMELAISIVNQLNDDRQIQQLGVEVPEAYSHITGVERAKWFDKGYESGSIKGADAILSAKHEVILN